MRFTFPAVLLLAATACASHREHFGPPRGGFGGPDGPGNSGGPGGGRALFISPMGEPFRVDRPERAWFAGTDSNGDGRLTSAEFRADAARFFRVLDRHGDGEIDPADVDVFENQLVPEVRVRDGGPGQGRGGTGAHGSGGPGGGGRGPGGGGPGGGGPGGGGPGGGGRGRGGPGGAGSDGNTAAGHVGAGREGAARFSYLDLPEPVTPADRNFNRGVDADEWARTADERFVLLDRNHDGLLTAGELPPVDTRGRGGPGGTAGRDGGFGNPQRPPAGDRDDPND